MANAPSRSRPPTTRTNTTTEEDLKTHGAALRGDDVRLVRWGATDHTVAHRDDGGCKMLPRAMSIIANRDLSEELRDSACELATFCVTDSPEHRAMLATAGPALYSSLVDLATNATDAHASARACHLIYIAAFSNVRNHQGLIGAGAVPALGVVVKSESSTPLQVMWAAAALQNLAASYCVDEIRHGGCYWEWTNGNNVGVEITKDSLPVISDGGAARRAIAGDSQLVERLMEWACRGPVWGEPSPQNPFPGDNGIDGRDDLHENIVPWAAMAALKNTALEPTAKAVMEPDILFCACRMAQSKDWLEESKAKALLEFFRRKDPCWFQDEAHFRTSPLCVDRYFIDNNGNGCGELDGTDNECSVSNSETGWTAKDSCCECSGGDREDPGLSEEL